MELGLDQLSSSSMVITTTVASLCANAETSSPTAPSSLTDDPKGAFLFCVAVVCIYGLSIVAFIGSHIKKRHVNKDEERQISHYLKNGHPPAAMNGNQFRVLRFKTSALLCSTLGQRHNHSATSWQLNAPSRPPWARKDHKKDAETSRSNPDVDDKEFLPQTEQPRRTTWHPMQRQSSLPETALRMPGRSHVVRSASVGDAIEEEIPGLHDNVGYFGETQQKISASLAELKSLLPSNHTSSETEATGTSSSQKTHPGKAERATVPLRDSNTNEELHVGQGVGAEGHGQSPRGVQLINAQTRNTRPFGGRRSALFPV